MANQEFDIVAHRAARLAAETAEYNSEPARLSRGLAAEINALVTPAGMSVTACSRSGEGVVDGEIVKIYSVEVTGKILGTNHAAVRTLTVAADPAAVVAEIQKDLKKQAKEAKAKAKFQPERIR